MWRSDLILGVLPPEFNARLVFPTFVSGKVYLIHCREPNMRKLEARVNADYGRLGRHLRLQR